MAVNLTTQKTEESEMVELFSIDDKPFMVPKKPRLNIALKTMKLMRENEDAAAVYMLEALLGEEAFDALAEYEGLTPEVFQLIVEEATKLVFGDKESPKAS